MCIFWHLFWFWILGQWFLQYRLLSVELFNTRATQTANTPTRIPTSQVLRRPLILLLVNALHTAREERARKTGWRTVPTANLICSITSSDKIRVSLTATTIDTTSNGQQKATAAHCLCRLGRRVVEVRPLAVDAARDELVALHHASRPAVQEVAARLETLGREG